MENNLSTTLVSSRIIQFKQALLEKYWTNTNEQRINRKQFILRWLLIIITWWITSYIVTLLIPSIPREEAILLTLWWKVTSIWFAVNAILGLVVYYPFYRMNKMMYIKRYADFNNNGKSPRVLLPISYYGLVLFTLFGVIIGYTGSPNAEAISGIWTGLLLSITIVLWFSAQLFLAAIFCIFLMFVIALFTWWTKDANNYWPVSTGTPAI